MYTHVYIYQFVMIIITTNTICLQAAIFGDQPARVWAAGVGSTSIGGVDEVGGVGVQLKETGRRARPIIIIIIIESLLLLLLLLLNHYCYYYYCPYDDYYYYYHCT